MKEFFRQLLWSANCKKTLQGRAKRAQNITVDFCCLTGARPLTANSIFLLALPSCKIEAWNCRWSRKNFNHYYKRLKNIVHWRREAFFLSLTAAVKYTKSVYRREQSRQMKFGYFCPRHLCHIPLSFILYFNCLASSVRLLDTSVSCDQVNPKYSVMDDKCFRITSSSSSISTPNFMGSFTGRYCGCVCTVLFKWDGVSKLCLY